MARNLLKIPQSLIFVCEKHRLSVLDSSVLEDFLQDRAEPWLELSVGPESIFETRPIKVIERSRSEIWVVGANYTVRVDLVSRDAYKILSDGSQFEFRGGLKSADERKGWIPISKGS